MKAYRAISGRDYRGRHRTSEEARTVAQLRRRKLVELGLCLNGASHGVATHGVRCQRCAHVHKHGASSL